MMQGPIDVPLAVVLPLKKAIHYTLDRRYTRRFIWEGGEIETREEIYGGRGGYL